MRKHNVAFLGIAVAFCGLATALASVDKFSVTIRLLSSEEPGEAVGTLRFRDSDYGLIIEPELHGLKPGPYALHLHENPSCEKGGNGTLAGAAGSHYDPEGKKVHKGPYRNGHLGDLPNLIVENDGTASIPVLAPRLRSRDVRGKSLVIHAGADRYATHGHHHHGTGGSRMYCGVVDALDN